MKNTAKQGRFILLTLLAVLAGCSTSRRAGNVSSYGGSWSQTKIVSEQATQTAVQDFNNPGDTSRTNRQGQGNLAQIKKDIRYITSRESIEKLKTEVQESITDTAPYDQAAQKKTAREYFSNINIVAGLALGTVGLLTLLPFPLIGFTALLLGALFGIAGIYDLKNPDSKIE